MPPLNPSINAWEAPPPKPGNPAKRQRGRPSPWEPIAKELRKSPHSWLKVAVAEQKNPRTYTDVLSRIRHGKPSCFAPPGSFEASLQREKDGTYVYLRYVGEPGE